MATAEKMILHFVFILMIIPLPELQKKEEIVISAFNNTTKDNGFYLMHVSKRADPELLTMGPYLYCAPYNDIYLSGFSLKRRAMQKFIL